MAGFGAGVVGAVVSQPADAVLTWLAGAESKSSEFFSGFRELVGAKGLGSVGKGMGERIVWAGAIIGGQFAVYDVVRGMVGVGDEGIRQAVIAAQVVAGAGGGGGG